jgi:hypothetical protein
VTVYQGMQENCRFPWQIHHGQRQKACIPW